MDRSLLLRLLALLEAGLALAALGWWVIGVLVAAGHVLGEGGCNAAGCDSRVGAGDYAGLVLLLLGTLLLTAGAAAAVASAGRPRVSAFTWAAPLGGVAACLAALALF